MTAEEKLAKIAELYERITPLVGNNFESNHVRHNIEGALLDMERTGVADDVCLKTLHRACDQLVLIEQVLGI